MHISVRIGSAGDSSSLFFILFYFILFYFILFYFILFYFILFYFILLYFILFYFILFYFIALEYRNRAVKETYIGLMCLNLLEQ